MGLQREGVEGRYVTFYPQDTGHKSRHQWICLAASSISRKMDNWTLLSARFDVSEEVMMEVQGRLQRHRRVGNGGVEQVGLMRGEGKERKMCTYAREKSWTGWDKRKTQRQERERKRQVPQQRLVFKHLPVPAYAEGRNGCLIPLHFYYSCS